MPRRSRATLAVLGAVLLAGPATPARAGEIVVRSRGDVAPRIVEVGGNVAQALRRWRARPGVRYAVPNHVAKASGFVPDDPGRGRTRGGWAKVQWNFTGPFGVNAPDAWQRLIQVGRPGARGIVVAVLDTGVAYRQRDGYLKSPDLNATRFVRGWDFVSNDPYPYDKNGHGTHVASTIAEATNNGVGLTGLAYGATIMPVRVLDDAGEGDAGRIARGIYFAARRGAQVINLSLEFSTDIRASDVPELLDAINYAHRKGAVLVGASGNEQYPLVAYPAKARNVIAVGATTEHGCLSDFSNTGGGLDVVAPGGGSDSSLQNDPNCRPDSAAGGDIYQVTLEGRERRRFGIPSGYEGTSMAAPHVSAIAALVLASGILGPKPTPKQVQQRIEQTARDLGPTGYDRRYGWGLVNAAAAVGVVPASTLPPATGPTGPTGATGAR